MKKLLIAVLVLSFLGFGPLKSFFYNGAGVDSDETPGIPILEKIKGSSDKKKEQTFLAIEKGRENAAASKESAILLKYDTSKNKMMVGSVLIPGNSLLKQEEDFEQLKKMVEEDYAVNIDYCFIFDPTGLAKIIDQLAPKGIIINAETKGNKEQKVLKGSDILSLIENSRSNSNNMEELFTMFMSLKEEYHKILSSERIVTLAPNIVNEALNSIDTDIGKGKLLDLGLNIISNPITSVEPLELIAKSQEKQVENVNKMIRDENGKSPVIY